MQILVYVGHLCQLMIDRRMHQGEDRGGQQELDTGHSEAVVEPTLRSHGEGLCHVRLCEASKGHKSSGPQGYLVRAPLLEAVQAALHTQQLHRAGWQRLNLQTITAQLVM